MDDNAPGLSSDDRKFMNLMSDNINVNDEGCLEMPLPLKEDSLLPNNRREVSSRTANMLNRLKRDEEKFSKCNESIIKALDKGHIEIVSNDQPAEIGKSWWLPIFSVQHPKTLPRSMMEYLSTKCYYKVQTSITK